MTFRAICLIGSLLISYSTHSAHANCAQLHQGEIIQVQIQNAEQIQHQGQQVIKDSDGTFLIASGRDAATNDEISYTSENQELTYSFNILPTKWDIQNLKGVQPRKVTPKPEDETAILKERELLRNAMKDISPIPNWKEGFIIPVEGRTSGKFGGQRIMNGIKKNPHAGMDIAAPIGTDIKAAGDGVIVLAEKELFYSGNVMIIDHGFGLYTIYAHLNDFVANKGDFVKKGDIIAHVGKTGRVTGPHLHWGASLQGTKFNPQSLLTLLSREKLCLNSPQNQ